MKELITIEQANRLMLAILVIAPVLGLVLGAIAKRVKAYTIVGVLIGAGNFALWTTYSAITNRLGLDTVKNLLVNLTLFIVVGIVIGFVLGKLSGGKSSPQE